MDDKAKKVLVDVGKAMFSEQFLTELFKPQDMYSTSSTKQIFEKLAHSSIMRLNRSSMDKLFDLMTMGLKYQFLQCTCPQQFMHITLHHLEATSALVDSPSFTTLLQSAISHVLKLYTTFSHGHWIRLQQSLLRFVQGRRVKVSLFLQHQMQLSDGSIVIDNKGRLPHGTEVPGSIRTYEGPHLVNERFFSSISERTGYFESNDILNSDSTLGTNMYVKDFKPHVKYGTTKIASSEEAAQLLLANGFIGSDFKAQSKEILATGGYVSSSITPSSAKAELNMLADLLGMGGADTKGDSDGRSFKINLFPDSGFHGAKDSKGVDGDDSGGMIFLDIDATADAKSMQSYLAALDLDDDNDGRKGGPSESKARGSIDDDDDDLLALMDSAK